MKKSLLIFSVLLLLSLATYSQVQFDKSIQLTSTASGEHSITGLEAPVNGTDAANKAYVDAKVAAGGGSLTMISAESASTYSFGDAMRYCRNLSESGFSDWRLPTFTELTTLVSKGGTVVSNDASANNIWLADRPTANASLSTSYQAHLQFIRLSDGSISSTTATTAFNVRCVR